MMISLLRRGAVLLWTCTAILAMSTRASAQATQTEEELKRAAQLYENLDVERAVSIFRKVVSPAYLSEITREQRVRAYKYIGASLATTGQRDSALAYFRAAIERDPFADLDPQVFTEQERSVFSEAKRLSFAVATREMADTTIDPAKDHVTWYALTTHDGDLNVEVASSDGAVRVPIFNGRNDQGIREVTWNGFMSNGRLAPPGSYELVVAGRSRLIQGATDTVRLFFDLQHKFPALEDTLPSLTAAMLLPERHRSSAPARDLLKGVTVTASAFAISSVIANSKLGNDRSVSMGVGGAALGTGLIAFASRQRNRDIPPNIAENRRRQLARAEYNDGIRKRNLDRLAQTKLVFLPASGVGR